MTRVILARGTSRDRDFVPVPRDNLYNLHSLIVPLPVFLETGVLRTIN